MLIVVPVSKSDAHLIPAFTSALKRAGGCKRHTSIVVATQEVADEAQKITDVLTELTSACALHVLPIIPQGGWPVACNLHFLEVVELLKHTNKLPWFWMELDCTVLASGWADKLEDELFKSQKPYLGALAPTWKVQNPNTPEEKLYQDGEHMMGCGVYPADHAFRGIFWKYPRTGLPFDVANQSEVIVAGVHPTKLIQHQFSTVNYRRYHDEIICDNKESKHGISYAGPLSETAVVHHGCKDGSLSKLFDKAETEPEPATKTVDSAQTTSIFVQSAEPTTEEQAAQVSALSARLALKSVRLNELAAEQGVEPAVLRTWLAKNGFSVSTPGWIEVSKTLPTR